MARLKSERMDWSLEKQERLQVPLVDQWVELYTDIPLDECLTSIRDEPFFFP